MYATLDELNQIGLFEETVKPVICQYNVCYVCNKSDKFDFGYISYLWIYVLCMFVRYKNICVPVPSKIILFWILTWTKQN